MPQPAASRPPTVASSGPGGIDRAAALRYLYSRRCPQGGYSFYRTPAWGVEEPNAPDTFAALDALRLLGEPAAEDARSAAWLQGLQDADGSWPTLTIAADADAALDLLGTSPRYELSPWLHRQWALRLERGNASQRAWAGTLRSLLQLTRLARRHAPERLTKDRQAIARRLAQARDASGVWSIDGPDLYITAVALNLAHEAGLPVDTPPVTAWWRRCEDSTLGLRPTPDAWLTTAGTLCGGLGIAVRLGLQPRHPDAIATQIRLLQHPSGGFGARHRALATLQDTRLALTAASRLDKLLQQENDHERL